MKRILFLIVACTLLAECASPTAVPLDVSRSTPATVAKRSTSAATRLWFLAPIISSTIQIVGYRLDVYDETTGTTLGIANFYGYSAGIGIATNPDQRHVYFSLSRNSVESKIVEVDAQTYALRYVPLPSTNGNDTRGLSASPDGSRLYATTTRAVYVIDTTLRRIIAARGHGLFFAAALSPDGSALYAVRQAGLVAMDTTKLTFREFARGSSASQLTASDSRVYALVGPHIRLYDASTLAYAGEIAGPKGSGFRSFASMAIDNVYTRMVVTYTEVGSLEGYAIVDTVRQAIVANFPATGTYFPPGTDAVTNVVWLGEPGDECALRPPSYLQRGCIPSGVQPEAEFTTTN